MQKKTRHGKSFTKRAKAGKSKIENLRLRKFNKLSSMNSKELVSEAKKTFKSDLNAFASLVGINPRFRESFETYVGDLFGHPETRNRLFAAILVKSGLFRKSRR